MNSLSLSLSFWVGLKPSFPSKSRLSRCREGNIEAGAEVVPALSYHKFVDFALAETKLRTHLVPSSSQEKFSHIQAVDGKTELRFQAFEASKIRLLRSMYIHGDDTVQVLDFTVFPRVEFDLPIFCANFFTNSATSIIVLDLNPLHDVVANREYKEKYYKQLLPLGMKYAGLLPWGGKLTAESLRFFSPMVIWTRLTPSRDSHDILFAAFKDYYKAWLDLLDHAVEETEASLVMCNREAQHRYLTWRAEKDPGHHMLKRLIGEARARDVLRRFLFSGVDELASKNFLDYFPEYRLDNGTVNEKRSVIGKSFEKRPWDNRGEFIGETFL